MFFVKQLFRDYEVHHLLVQLIFSITFALSCTMFELIIFEIIGYLDSRYFHLMFLRKIRFSIRIHSSRYFHWNLGLYLMLFMVIAVIPFYIGYFCISQIRYGNFFVLFYKFCIIFSLKLYFSVHPNFIRPMTVLIWFIYLYFFWKIGNPFPILSPKQVQIIFMFY